MRNQLFIARTRVCCNDAKFARKALVFCGDQFLQFRAVDSGDGVEGFQVEGDVILGEGGVEGFDGCGEFGVVELGGEGVGAACAVMRDAEGVEEMNQQGGLGVAEPVHEDVLGDEVKLGKGKNGLEEEVALGARGFEEAFGSGAEVFGHLADDVPVEFFIVQVNGFEQFVMKLGGQVLPQFAGVHGGRI